MPGYGLRNSLPAHTPLPFFLPSAVLLRGKQPRHNRRAVAMAVKIQVPVEVV